MAQDKGMLFYYDWLEPLCALPATQFKRLVIAMPDGSETNQFWNGQKSRLLR
jgi:hypothetical protein